MEKEISIKVNARHVGQLGRELVTDYVTALTELVKIHMMQTVRELKLHSQICFRERGK